ncbi:MAG: MFS transporter [Rhizomicrobium sp.]
MISDTPMAGRPRPFLNRHYVLVMVTLIYVVNYMNRQIVNILLPQIKAEFHLTDTQLGLLAGPVFAVVYAVLGLPLAQVADRVNRRSLIAVTLALFSATTFLAGFVANFVQLLVARFTTGIGEAGTSPAVSSMISDIYPPEQRATALGFYSGGLNIGLLIAFFGGGWFAEHYGWRAAFMAAGAPGVVLVFLFLFTVSDPGAARPKASETPTRRPGFGPP